MGVGATQSNTIAIGGRRYIQLNTDYTFKIGNSSKCNLPYVRNLFAVCILSTCTDSTWLDSGAEIAVLLHNQDI